MHGRRMSRAGKGTIEAIRPVHVDCVPGVGKDRQWKFLIEGISRLHSMGGNHHSLTCCGSVAVRIAKIDIEWRAGSVFSMYIVSRLHAQFELRAVGAQPPIRI